jgi:hypothetical protein
MITKLFAIQFCRVVESRSLMSTIDPEFDLIRLDSNENVAGVWIGTANSLREAVETNRILAATRPGKYMVYSQSAGSKAVYEATNGSVSPLTERLAPCRAVEADCATRL